MPPAARTSKTAFTLVEILLVVVIIGLVAGLGLPALGRSVGGAKLREATRTVVALNKYARNAAVIGREHFAIAYLLREGSLELLNLGGGAASNAELAMEQVLSGGFGAAAQAGTPDDGPVISERVQLRRLPDGITIEEVRVDESLKTEDAFWVQYFINGMCDGHSIVLRDERGRGMKISVEALTGRVTVEDAP